MKTTYLLLAVLAGCATVPVVPMKLDDRILTTRMNVKPEPVEPHVGVYKASFSYPKAHHHLLGTGITLQGPGSSSSSPTFADVTVTTLTATSSLRLPNSAALVILANGTNTGINCGFNSGDQCHIDNAIGAAGATNLVPAFYFNHTNNALGANDMLVGFYDFGTLKFSVDAEGDVAVVGSVTGATTITGNTFALNSNGAVSVSTNAIVRTAPTISSGFGGSPSIASNNGTAAFTVNVGTGGATSSGVIGLPAATNGWVCNCTDLTTPGVNVTKMTAATTTTCTITNYNSTTGIAANWAASDILHCTAMGR